MRTATQHKPLLAEAAAAWLAGKAKEYRVPLLTAIAMGLLAHMYAFTNKLVNHDEAVNLFSKGMSLSSGRWGLDILSWVFPDYSMPWVYGIVSIVLISVAVCIMVDLFRVKSKLFQALLSGLVVTFPSLTGTFTYMFTASSYAAAFVLAVLAVWCMQKRDWRFWAGALVCMVFSLSIYQAYIAVSAGLLVVVLIRQVLLEQDLRSVFYKGLRFLGFLVLSLGIYYGATKLLLSLFGTEFNSYAAANISFSLSALRADIRQAYTCFWEFFSQNEYGIIPNEFSRLVHRVCLCAAGSGLLLWAVTSGRKVWDLVFLCALLAVFPLAVNCMFFFVSDSSIHTLVLYSFVCVYVLVIVAAQACLSLTGNSAVMERCARAALNLVALGLCMTVAVNTYVSNEVYLNLHLKYENAYSFYSTLYADIRMLPGYSSDSKLVILGDYRARGFYETHFSEVAKIMGAEGFSPTDYSYDYFLQYYLGVYIPGASSEEIAAIMESEQYRQMAVYPYYGSVQMIGDIIVVKMS